MKDWNEYVSETSPQRGEDLIDDENDRSLVETSPQRGED